MTKLFKKHDLLRVEIPFNMSVTTHWFVPYTGTANTLLEKGTLLWVLSVNEDYSLNVIPLDHEERIKTFIKQEEYKDFQCATYKASGDQISFNCVLQAREVYYNILDKPIHQSISTALETHIFVLTKTLSDKSNPSDSHIWREIQIYKSLKAHFDLLPLEKISLLFNQ